MYLNKGKQILLNNKALIKYSILNYIDKFLFFILPLSFLYFTKDIKLYNTIEYVYSIANVLVVVGDLGIKYYLFYGYKIADNKEIFLFFITNIYKKIFLFYFIISIAITIALLLNLFQTINIYFVIRTTFLLLILFYNTYFRLIDKPSKTFLFSIPTSLLILLFIIGNVFIQNSNFILFFYFFFQIIIAVTIFGFSNNKDNKQSIYSFRKFYKNVIKYVWPLLLNTFLVMLVANFIKIYAYDNFSQNDMFSISFTLRVGLLLQLTHASIIGFFSKDLFMDEFKKFSNNIITKYLLLITSILIFIIIVIYLFDKLNIFRGYNFDFSSIFLIAYIYMWCLTGLLEIFYNRTNNNKLLLKYYIIAFLIFLSSLLVKHDIDKYYISISMFSYISIYFTLLLYNKYKLKI